MNAFLKDGWVYSKPWMHSSKLGGCILNLECMHSSKWSCKIILKKCITALDSLNNSLHQNVLQSIPFSQTFVLVYVILFNNLSSYHVLFCTIEKIISYFHFHNMTIFNIYSIPQNTFTNLCRETLHEKHDLYVIRL